MLSSPVRQQGGPRRAKDDYLSFSSKLRQCLAHPINNGASVGLVQHDAAGAEAGGAEGVMRQPARKGDALARDDVRGAGEILHRGL